MTFNDKLQQRPHTDIETRDLSRPHTETDTQTSETSHHRMEHMSEMGFQAMETVTSLHDIQ